ncbi:N-formylglutamate amidohydrolase [Cypionkella sp.]|uniref:N-formylglutamate amidohydrolase n=1 Tax=Cypionkella sp. TaxID=2811411 RepID=UPI00271CB0F8|nr:N-formylglutamate amidohydrolase [Cypionkella sp.]MDO8986294.1 N-formylglutamate amidohydrolase [Cypionkella sp.]MDP2051042.1 N-formylglutamate amidohydrolase [Cypionkella sp.]
MRGATKLKTPATPKALAPLAQAFLPVIENVEAAGRIILVCEHACNYIPPAWGDLGLTPAQRMAHIAWDSGALAVSRGLAQRLDAVLIHAPVSRLVYDCNRAPDMPGAMPARSEIHDIPGNATISASERFARTEAVYLPWATGLHELIAKRIALGLRPVVVTIHSFTPVFHGMPRRVEFGVIHDADPHLAMAILNAAHKLTGLQAELNAPYSAADDVTHTLRVQATPYALPNAMLEIRNDLIATPEAAEVMADQLAAVLNLGLVEIQRQAKAS